MIEIDLIMLSKLGTSDGGRETWLYNFLNYLKDNYSDIIFNLITLEKSDISAITTQNSQLILSHSMYQHKIKKIPYSVGFVLYCWRRNFFKIKTADHVMAVGGLNEALSAFLGYGFRGVKGKKIIWLRTIYTKEKGYALNKFTQKTLLIVEKILYKYYFDIVITNGKDTANFYRKLGIECSVIDNAIPLEKWTNLTYDSNSNVLKIGYIGRLSEVKGISAFLNSIDIILSQNDDLNIEFHIIGGGPFENKASIISSKYPDKVFIYGEVSNTEIPKILKNIDCCVALTYLTDFLGGGGVSNALIEQMAAKKIIVCWDNDIFRNVLDDNSAYFVEQGNELALANCFNEILLNKCVAYEKALKSRILSQKYSIESHVISFLRTISYSKP